MPSTRTTAAFSAGSAPGSSARPRETDAAVSQGTLGSRFAWLLSGARARVHGLLSSTVRDVG
eukprot:5636393-Prymnesium_polylepis.1